MEPNKGIDFDEHIPQLRTLRSEMLASITRPLQGIGISLIYRYRIDRPSPTSVPL
jgi:hypothetical protein